jgi:hypothetical protein
MAFRIIGRLHYQRGKLLQLAQQDVNAASLRQALRATLDLKLTPVNAADNDDLPYSSRENLREITMGLLPRTQELDAKVKEFKNIFAAKPDLVRNGQFQATNIISKKSSEY